MIEALWIGRQTPLSDHGRLVTNPPEQLGKVCLIAIETIAVPHKSMQMAVLPGQDHGSVGATIGIRAKAVLKEHALRSQLVDVGGRVDALQPSIISADSMGGVVNGEYEDNVRLPRQMNTSRGITEPGSIASRDSHRTKEFPVVERIDETGAALLTKLPDHHPWK